MRANLASHFQIGIQSNLYRIPNNPKSSSTYFWLNLLKVEPCADHHTFIITTIPEEKEEIIRTRFSNHPSGSIANWAKYETIGEPNKRVNIFFFNQKDSDDYNTPIETHIIDNKHLYSDNDIGQLCIALGNYIRNGIFVNPFIENNQK